MLAAAGDRRSGEGDGEGGDPGGDELALHLRPDSMGSWGVGPEASEIGAVGASLPPGQLFSPAPDGGPDSFPVEGGLQPLVGTDSSFAAIDRPHRKVREQLMAQMMAQITASSSQLPEVNEIEPQTSTTHASSNVGQPRYGLSAGRGLGLGVGEGARGWGLPAGMMPHETEKTGTAWHDAPVTAIFRYTVLSK